MPDKTIVTGVDGMEGGRDALRLAAVLAEAIGAGIVAVGAFPHFHRPALTGAPAVEAQRQSTQEMLDGEIAETGVSARTHVLADASPGRALHRIAECENAALIVVGSTRKSLMGRILIGDDALGTLHGSPVPVAVAPRGFAPPDGGLRRIGVGYDDGPEARQALDVAADLAERCGAEIELLDVIVSPAVAAAEVGYSMDWLEDARKQREQMLSQARTRLRPRTTGSAVIGIPAAELEDLERRVDLLVVGSRGWGPVRRVLLGSTATALMRRAHCPVLVVPRGSATGQPGENVPDDAGSEAPSHA